MRIPKDRYRPRFLPITLLLLLAACGSPPIEGSNAGANVIEADAATPGPPPGNDTEIGRVARQCSIPVYCGGIGFIDCDSAADGPAYYFERRTGKIVGRCGGICMAANQQCAKECPPPGWTCRPSGTDQPATG